MKLGSKKILKLSYITAILFVGIMTVLCMNNSVQAYNIGDMTYFSELDPSNNLYCIEYGVNFEAGNYYCFDKVNASDRISYVVGHVNPSDYSYYTGIFRTDIRQNFVWEELNGNSHANEYGMKQDIEKLRTEADLMQSINSNSITMTKPDDSEGFLEENEEGKYGPFVINYPSLDGKWIGDSMTVTLNGKELTTIPESGKEFYLGVEDGVILGEENKIEISYRATHYTGTIESFTMERVIHKYATCSVCGQRFQIASKGFSVNEQIIKNPSEPWTLVSGNHVGNNCSDLNLVYDDEFYIESGKTQDVAIITAVPTPIDIDETITFLPGRKLVINLTKKDNSVIANLLKGIEFDVTVSADKKTYFVTDENGKQEQISIVTDDKGEAKITIITSATSVKVTLAEKDNKLYINDGPIVINFEYSNKRWTPTIEQPANSTQNLNNIVQQGDWFEFQLDIVNRAKVENFKIIKINAASGERLSGIEFKIILNNAKTKDNLTTIIRQTDGNGEINLGELEVIDPSQDIIITLEEKGTTGADYNFTGLPANEEAVITIRHGQEGCNVNIIGTADPSIINASYSVQDNVIIAEIKNEVTIDLSGRVWEDGQTGIKPVKSPNGLYDNGEKTLANIKVNLKRVSDNAVVAETFTDANGNYAFKDIPASLSGSISYYIEFTYDGINYIATARDVGTDDTIDSDVTEVNRNGFNDKFRTIEKDVAIGTDGTRTSLEYDTTTDPTKAVLVTNKGDGTVKDEFAMTATTLATTYNKNTSNIDMGLVIKSVDLAAVTDIYLARVNINGKVKTYNYNDISNLNKDENGNPVLETLQQNDAKYNLYLYSSDYNYRIGDYNLPAAQSDTLNVNTNNAASELLTRRQNDGTLNIEVTYQILLNNQSATNATINKIAYYYDTNYTLQGEVPELVTIGGKTYNKVVKDVNITLTDAVNQGVAPLTFIVNKDSTGNLNLGTMQNWVEIVSYSTNEGCVDIDSAPDNIETHQTEDDTDDAPGLVIQLNNLQREIGGYVFEDKEANENGAYRTEDGEHQDDEPMINDIIVQLIEIKEVSVGGNALKLEYIWQETTTGSSKVKYVTLDGRAQGEYTVSNQPGHYTFKGFIPGNYIVRFIYGDGTYYDTNTAANLTKYNGQDYKSTIDPNFDKVLHEEKEYNDNSSMARDNEARRIEEIAYARSVTSVDDLIINSKEKLQQTWMCAETSKISMDISNNTAEGDIAEALTKGINFGLMQRPKSAIALEKHIISVKIDDVTEATTSLENYDEAEKNGNSTIKLTSNTGNSVFATLTDKTKNERGIWKVEVQTDKLTGKGISITYGYRLRNVGDAEYIGSELANQLASGKTYAEIATESKNLSSKAGYYNIGSYLGTAYYSGVPTDDRDAGLAVQIEDYISTSNGMKLDLATSNFTVTESNSQKHVWTYEGTSANQRQATKSSTESVNVIRSQPIKLEAGKINDNIKQKVYIDSLDATSGKKEFTYRSYAAQLVWPTNSPMVSEAGTLSNGMNLGNLETVQSYVDDLNNVSIKTIVPENDEALAETVIITMPTGQDKETPTMLIITITASLAVLAIGIVLIKKYVIK